jgi:hypothetical protein
MTEGEISLRVHFDQRIDAIEKKVDDFIVFWREERSKALEHIQARAVELEKRVIDRAAAQERAIDKAEKAMGERLTGMNEFRETLRDQASKLATREQVELSVGALEKRIRDMEQWSANIQGRLLVMGGVWGLVVVLISVMLNYTIRMAFPQ